MSKFTNIQKLTTEFKNSTDIISKAEQSQVKGGLLLYCEEKRRTINGKVYTTQQWKVASNGSIWLTIKM